MTVMALAAPAFYRYASTPARQLGHSDFFNHQWWASQIRFFPPRITMPHPMLHLPTAALSRLIGSPAAITAVMCFALGLTVIVLIRIGRMTFAGMPGLGRLGAASFAVGYLVVESPTVLANALEWGNPRNWTAVNHMYLSPTETLLVPFALMLLMSLRSAVGQDFGDRSSRRDGIVLFAASVAAVLTKPTFSFVLLLVVPVYLVGARRLTVERTRFLCLWFLLPTVLIMIWQFWFVRSGQALVAYGTGGFAFRPLGTLRSVGLDQAGLPLLAPLIVVPICLWAGWRRYLREPAVGLAMGALAVSILILVLFQETGPRSFEANFTKPAFISWVALHVVSWRFLLARMAEARRAGQWPSWVVPAAAMLVVGVAAGVVHFCDAVGIIHLVPQPPVV
jgi:hypothetical protein